MPRCRPKDYTDKFGDNPNITLIQIEYLILGMPKLSHTERYLRNLITFAFILQKFDVQQTHNLSKIPGQLVRESDQNQNQIRLN